MDADMSGKWPDAPGRFKSRKWFAIAFSILLGVLVVWKFFRKFFTSGF